MKNKYFSAAAAISLFAFYFTTCGNDTGGPETWTWTERAFSLEITGSGETIQVGDSFTLNYMGIGTLAGTIRGVNEAESSRAIGDNTNPGMGRIIFDPGTPGNEDDDIVVYTPPVPPGPPAPPPVVYIDYIETELMFPGHPKPVKGVVNRDGLIVNITLPESSGDNEAGGKSYNLGTETKWTFNADKTYTVYHTPDDTLLEFETGTYSWDSENNTLFLLAERHMANPEAGLTDKGETLAAFRQMAADRGMTDAEVFAMTGGRLKTVDAYLFAFINKLFGLQVFTYEPGGDSFSQFTRNLATALDLDTGNMTIGGFHYTDTETAADSGNRHYLLEGIEFDEAKARLTDLLGTPDAEGDDCGLQSETNLSAADSVILEDCVFNGRYRLVKKEGGAITGSEWYRQ